MTFLFETEQFKVHGDELIVDCFAGGGGASTGIFQATGRHPDVAINHCGPALAMHEANHPDTMHVCRNINTVVPHDLIGGRPIGLLWASPDCKHFSKSKGGKPVKRNIRDLAWNVIAWAKRRPRVIILENVEEFQDWGPLVDRDGDWYPDPDRKGETFRRWVKELRRLGYRVEWRELRACDYGAPTIRKRLFVVARRDGEKIVWPKSTHGKPECPAVLRGKLQPWRTAADIIDWSVPCPSIFDTAEDIKQAYGVRAVRPLADNTLKRIAAGVKRYVIDAQRPFIVTCNHGGDGFRGQGLDEPFNTVTAARDAHGFVVPIVTRAQHGGGNRDTLDPLHTVTASPKDQNALITAHIQRDFGCSVGHGADEPLGTITTGGGGKAAVVSAFLAQHNTGVVGHDLQEPVSTITQRGTQQAVVSAHMMSLKGSDRRMRAIDAPAATICAEGTHAALVAALMVKYYGCGVGQGMDEPCHSVTTHDRFGLVTVTIDGASYVIVDIGMRMLTPRELFRAQGFPDDYIIKPEMDGRALPKTEQIACCGNSVCPPLAAALAGANCGFLTKRRVAA